MKVAIIGSRKASVSLAEIDRAFAVEHVSPTSIISGGAQGVDRCAEAYALAKEMPCEVVLPDYKAHGNAAPHIRNRRIVDEADIVLAVWDGVSHGTKNVMEDAKKKGKPVIVIDRTGKPPAS